MDAHICTDPVERRAWQEGLEVSDAETLARNSGRSRILAVMVACGGRPHDRAEAVMESAVERFTVLHDRMDEIVSSAEERVLPDGCLPVVTPLNPMLWLDKPPDVSSKMRVVSREHSTAFNQCVSRFRALNRDLAAARRVRDRLTSEALLQRVTTLRARLATVPPDGLARVLDAAGTDDQAWVALHEVNSPNARVPVPAPGDVELSLGELEEELDQAFADVDRLMELARQKRAEFYELAGEPLPEP